MKLELANSTKVNQMRRNGAGQDLKEATLIKYLAEVSY